mmetsp:Transcript_9948/g.29139  ORF Transcript_9948/g.29139 Transcript_9948/m.29139 type:complete len:385 (+) Transcript_9948:182-1336(+)
MRRSWLSAGFRTVHASIWSRRCAAADSLPARGRARVTAARARAARAAARVRATARAARARARARWRVDGAASASHRHTAARASGSGERWWTDSARRGCPRKTRCAVAGRRRGRRRGRRTSLSRLRHSAWTLETRASSRTTTTRRTRQSRSHEELSELSRLYPWAADSVPQVPSRPHSHISTGHRRPLARARARGARLSAGMRTRETTQSSLLRGLRLPSLPREPGRPARLQHVQVALHSPARPLGGARQVCSVVLVPPARVRYALEHLVLELLAHVRQRRQHLPLPWLCGVAGRARLEGSGKLCGVGEEALVREDRPRGAHVHGEGVVGHPRQPLRQGLEGGVRASRRRRPRLWQGAAAQARAEQQRGGAHSVAPARRRRRFAR